MKYARLTKEQFEELHPEFANFLAAQSLDKVQWDDLKQNDPKSAEEQLDAFSDLIWESVLSRSEFLEHFSKNLIFLFRCSDSQIHSIVLRSLDASVDFLTKDGLQWLGNHMFTDELEMKIGKKPFGDDRNADIFELIRQGAFLTDGQLYNQIITIVES